MNAGTGGFDPQGDVRQALAAVVRDHGPTILADPRHLGDALNVLLPTAPEETGILVATARAGTGAQLAQQAAKVGPGAALEAVSANLAQSGVLDPQRSRWAVGEVARVMGFPISDPAPAAPAGRALGGMAAWSGSASVPPPPPAAPLGFPVPLPAAALGFPAPPPAAPLGFPAAPAASTPPPAAWPPVPPPPSGPPPFQAPTAFPPFSPPPAPSPFTPRPAPSAFTPPSAPPAFRGPSTPGPFGQGAPGSPPQGPQWAGARIPSRPSPPRPPTGSGSSGGPPPRAPPAGPRPKGGRPLALIAAAVVIVLIVGYLGVAAVVGLVPFKTAAPVAVATPTPTAAPTFTSTPTPTSTSSPTAKPSATGSPAPSQLSNLLPSYITGDPTHDICSPEPSAADVASGMSGEEFCDLTQNQSVAEQYVLYAGFPTEGPATAYFTSLITANGMKATQGNCQNLTLVNTSDGSSKYCENTYTTTGTKSASGSDFVFTGSPGFELGNTFTVSTLGAVCADVNSVDVLGFTDRSYAAMGILISCLGTEQDQQVNSDFLAGDFFLGS